ncbi:hypothetical protein ACFV2U_48240 [Streptomyces sp. NPDC059697]|uniref:hypothetical protein n=1 Tax=Streptomyces sp. NPDC059697 TaxID=3346912 RepID=UPI0036CEC335
MQTAVLDNADSEEPVELPMDVPGLELFRGAHLGRTFWCGVWLGGCGGQLTTRRCVDKICHFAHMPDPDALDSLCRRSSSRTSGTGSADHLYIKAAVIDWMARRGLKGEASILRDPTGEIRLGAQVTAEPSGYEPLHFILDSSALPEPGELHAGTVLGPGIDPDPRILREQGYVHRVRCVPDGAHRKVQIGTEHSNGTFDWYDFVSDTVGLNPDGLSTPAVVEIRRRRSDIVPIGVYARDLTAKPTILSSHFATAPAQPVDHTALVEVLRKALADGASVTRLQHCLDLLEAATRQGATAEGTTSCGRPRMSCCGCAAAWALRSPYRPYGPVPGTRNGSQHRRLSSPPLKSRAASLCGKGPARNGSLAAQQSARRRTSWTASPSRFLSPMPKSRNWFES